MSFVYDNNQNYLLSVMEKVDELVRMIRRDLSKSFDISDKSPYSNYRELCDAASTRFVYIFNNVYRKYFNDSRYKIGEAVVVHGEFRHSIKSDSMYWPTQHTWVEIRYPNSNKVAIYVDITCGQFKDVFEDIPEYYISTSEPIWYLADKNNLRFKNKLIRYIDRKFMLSPWKDNDCRIGLVEFMQFFIYGRISDTVRKSIIAK